MPPFRQLEVLLFAAAREAVGAGVVTLDLPVEATVADLRKELMRQWPQLAPLAQRSLIALDGAYAADQTRLAAARHAALIPPVSGG